MLFSYKQLLLRKLVVPEGTPTIFNVSRFFAFETHQISFLFPFLLVTMRWTLFWYSSWKFFGNRTDSTVSPYSPGFYHFSVLTLIVPSSDTRPYSFSVLARILPFPGTRSDSTIFRYLLGSTIFQYWHWFYLFPVLAPTVFWYSHGFYLFPVLARIL